MDVNREAITPLSFRRRSRRLSLTPLIDCIFILLIFFMLQTNFLRPRAIEFAKVAGGSVSSSDMTTILVELHANGSVWLNGGKSDMDGLRNYAVGIIAPDNARVILAVDPGVLLQRAVDVMDLFNQYDIINFAMSIARKFD